MKMIKNLLWNLCIFAIAIAFFVGAFFMFNKSMCQKLECECVCDETEQLNED